VQRLRQARPQHLSNVFRQDSRRSPRQKKERRQGRRIASFAVSGAASLRSKGGSCALFLILRSRPVHSNGCQRSNGRPSVNNAKVIIDKRGMFPLTSRMFFGHIRRVGSEPELPFFERRMLACRAIRNPLETQSTRCNGRTLQALKNDNHANRFCNPLKTQSKDRFLQVLTNDIDTKRSRSNPRILISIQNPGVGGRVRSKNPSRRTRRAPPASANRQHWPLAT